MSPPPRKPAPPERAQLMATCLVDALYPEVGHAAVAVLERLGVETDVPLDQTCCGQPAFNAGLWRDARAMGRHTLDVLTRDEAPIVVPSGSCADMLVHQYPILFADEEPYRNKAKAVAARTFELSQFVVDVVGVPDVGATCRGCLTYHACCHGLRGLGIETQPQTLLDHVAGIERTPLDDADTCCGFGGLFSLEMGGVSGAILGRKLDAIEASSADTVIVTDVSCLMHMMGGLRRRGSPVRVRHIAEILATRGESPAAVDRRHIPAGGASSGEG